MEQTSSEQCKLFVGGISWETTDDALRQHFGRYGSVVGIVIVKDRITGSPRGFAFVTLSDPSAVDKALQDSHEILGRTVEVKKAIPRSEQQQQHNSRGLDRNSRSNTNGRSDDPVKTKKIFVGGLSANLTEEEFKAYFEKFGRITDVVVMHDNMTHRPRGFGFITFDSEDAVEEVIQKSFHELSGKLVEVKRAVPKDGNGASGSGYNSRIGGGRGSNFNSYQHGVYATQSPRYGVLPGYGPFSGYGYATYPYGTGIYGGGYPPGGYAGFSYGVAPMAPRSPWSNQGMLGVRGSPVPYGSAAAVYPSYMNGGVGMMGMAANGYNGILGSGMSGKSGQLGNGDAHGAAGSVPNRGNVDVNSFGSGGSYGAASSKQNQRGKDERLKPCASNNSS